MSTQPRVYTSYSCSRCSYTLKAFETMGVGLTVINVDDSPEAIEELKQLGFHELPVVVTEDDRWSGHRMDKIVAHVRKAAANAA